MTDDDDVRDPDLVSLIDAKRAWQRLIDAPEWGKLMSIVQEQVDSLQQAIVFTPLATADGVYAQEFRKGQLEGRLSLANTVTSILEEIEVEIERKRNGG